MKTRAVIDVSELPTWAFGPKSLMWWGTLGYILIETSGFGLGIASYLYLAQKAQEWPLAAPPPELWPGILMTSTAAPQPPAKLRSQKVCPGVATGVHPSRTCHHVDFRRPAAHRSRVRIQGA